MPLNTEQWQRLNKAYTEITGKPVKHFVCPITLRDDPTSELCNGHILNDAIKTASRATIIQYKDIDSHFGQSIEAELVKWLNLPVTSPEEMIQQASGLKIGGPTGEMMDVFWANEAAHERFQQIELYRPDGTTFSRPFLRNHKLEAKRYERMPVEWTVWFVSPALDAALLKSGFLALFRMAGYAWVFDASGDKVRRHLKAFYENRGTKRDAAEYFSEFRQSNWVVMNDAMDRTKDTLEDGSVLFHYAEGGPRDGLLFAVSCLFKVNNYMVAVTLPSHNKDGHYSVAFGYYQNFLKDHSFQHSIHFGRFANETPQVSEQPIRMHMAAKFPPDSGAKQVSPPV